jgi:hypothetical protein
MGHVDGCVFLLDWQYIYIYICATIRIPFVLEVHASRRCNYSRVNPDSYIQQLQLTDSRLVSSSLQTPDIECFARIDSMVFLRSNIRTYNRPLVLSLLYCRRIFLWHRTMDPSTPLLPAATTGDT